jgi:hypothetical protein
MCSSSRPLAKLEALSSIQGTLPHKRKTLPQPTNPFPPAENYKKMNSKEKALLKGLAPYNHSLKQCSSKCVLPENTTNLPTIYYLFKLFIMNRVTI